jgi:shikimate dehydrogenase
MSNLLQKVGNGAALDLASTQHYAAILGAAPSKGARSPLLWNRAFTALGISGVMHPMDVTPENLGPLVAALREDSRFIGGAVAVPYKKDIVQHLDALEPEAEAIGAVNSIYRSGARLIGANTDGAAALSSIQKLFGQTELAGKSVLLLGVGGAGQAVAAFAAKAVGLDGTVHLVNRSSGIGGFAERLRRFSQVSAHTGALPEGLAAKVDVIVNATSIGSELVRKDGEGVSTLVGYTPLAPVTDVRPVPAGEDMARRFARENARSIQENLVQSFSVLQSVERARVYDIVYQPAQTLLLALARARGLPVLGGEAMNLEQAVIAFASAVHPLTGARPDAGAVKRFMSTE